MYNVRRVYFPYCLQQVSDDRHIVLNRFYKPIGFSTKDHIDYENVPGLAYVKGIGPVTAEKLSFRGKSDTDGIWLYGDICIPTKSAENMRNYLARLKILERLKVAR